MALPSSLKKPNISFLSGKFRDSGLENQFRLSTAQEWARLASLVSMVGGIFFLSGFWVDYVTLGIKQTSLVLLIIRVLFAALALGLGWLIRRSNRPEVMDFATLIVLLACVGATLFIIHQTPVPYIRHALTVFVFVIIFFVFVPTRIWINIVSAGILSVGFMIMATFIKQTPYAVMTMIVIYVALGNLLGWLAAVHLHSLRRLQWFNLQAELQTQARLLEEVQERRRAEESLKQLALGVAHNFNNSLMAITSNLQAAQGILRKGGEFSESQVFLNNAWQSAASGREVAQRLTLAVLGEANAQRGRVLVELGELVRQAQSIAQLTWARKDQPLEFSEKIDPQLWVMANRGELMEVFLNLFKNCLEAMTLGGHIRVQASRKAERIMVQVEDDGAGIAPEIQKKLFKPFASDKGVRGQGLGLAVSRGILNSLAGSITCQSEPGRGTTMFINLPAAPDCPQPVQEPAPYNISPQVQGKRLLLVEDEALVSLGVSEILRQEGYQVWQAKNVAEAKRRLSEVRPELVVCDFGLPDGNAWNIQQAVQHWAEKSGSPEPAFIVITGWSEAQLAEDALLSFKPFAWLQKPVDKQELLAVLREAAWGNAHTGQKISEMQI